MSELLLVTHPESTHHTRGLVGGWHDGDLTQRGVLQAQAIASVIGSCDAVFSSDLTRCHRTAEAIAQRAGHGAPALDSDLREQSYGIANGHPTGTVAYAPVSSIVDALTHHDGVEGSETRLDVATRVYRAIARIEAAGKEHGHKRMVVVSHGGSSTYVLLAWLGVPIEVVGSMRFIFSPGSITRLVRKGPSGDRCAEALADVSHFS